MGGEPTATPLLRRATASGDQAIQTMVKDGGGEGALCRGPQKDTKLYTFMHFVGIFNQNREDHKLFVL